MTANTPTENSQALRAATLAPGVENPFAAQTASARAGGNALAVAEQQKAIAEVQAALVIARANPRNPIAAMDRILNACTRSSLAESAIYTYARGGSNITGPTIRLAEAIAQCWGNIQFGIRELEQRNGESTVQAYAWDVETNTRREVTFQVPHIRATKQGVTILKDPRDIYEMVANQGARRLRACILAVIPGDVTESAVQQCEVTMRAKADVSPEATAKLLEAFAQFGVSKGQIEKRIQRRMDAIAPANVVALRKIYASLKDGMSSADEWFEPEAPANGEKLRAAATGQPLKKQASPASADQIARAGGIEQGANDAPTENATAAQPGQ